MNASAYVALQDVQSQMDALKEKKGFWGKIFGMSCMDIPFRQLKIQCDEMVDELVSEGEHEAECEEKDLGTNAEDVSSDIQKILKIQKKKEDTRLSQRVRDLEYRLERGRDRVYWNPKSRKARNEKGVRILKQKARHN